MSWRVIVISSRAKLDLKLNYMVIRGEETHKVFLSEISLLLIESTAVSMTAALLAELVKRKIKVIFCDGRRNPVSELVPYYGSHDSSAKIKAQINWSSSAKEQIWTEIVKEKIRQQMSLLKYSERSEAEILKRYLKEVELNDSTNREGLSAKIYFSALFGAGFSRSEDNLINAALNYGYSILLSAFNREIAANGFLTQLGLFHDNIFNPFNLASDLMEPFRPLVDRIVLAMSLEDFSHEEKMVLVNVLNQEVMIDHKKQYVNNAIKIYCKSVFDALHSEDVSMLRFYHCELSIYESNCNV